MQILQCRTISFIKLYFQGLYCSAECQKENWELHRDFCKERRRTIKKRREEKAKKGGKGGGGGERGKEEKELAQEEICRGRMAVLTFSEVD